MLIPDEIHLQKSTFDRGAYLKRLNRFNFLSSECSSIGSILKCEYNNFRLICSSSKTIKENILFLSLKFGERLCHLLKSTHIWFESQIIEQQNDQATKFQSITECEDLSNPLVNVKLSRQLSQVHDITDQELLRDKETGFCSFIGNLYLRFYSRRIGSQKSRFLSCKFYIFVNPNH